MSEKAKLLVVDDEPAMRDGLKMMLSAHAVETASNGEEALERIAKGGLDVVITDLRMPGRDGMEVLRQAKQAAPGLIVFMISAHGDIATAVEAMKLGAADFIQKPFKIDDVRARVKAALDKRELARPAPKGDAVGGPIDPKVWADFPEILGQDEVLARVLMTVRKVAPSPLPLLVLGETGVGKEAVARGAHRLSGRKGQCTTTTGQLPASLIESELFGHVKGAFTGATKDKVGYFEAAGGGTFFLDEVGDLPLPVQTKLLRVIQEKEIVRLGETKPRKIDCRLVAATHKDLPALVKAGQFREDLYFRLKVINVHIPPLRERKGDLLLLARQFLEREGKAQRKPRSLTFSPAALERLQAHRWPGNIRELLHACQNLAVLAPDDEVQVEDLEAALRG